MSTTSTPATITPTTKFVWLLKREFWEYRGSFFWAPAITAMVMLAFVLIGLLIAEVSANRHGVNLSGIHFDEISQRLSSGDLEKLHAGMDIGLLSLGVPIGITLFFVLLFYGIGALYNDRADRSVLFWKSLPISDSLTVLAKACAMGLMAPALAVAALIALDLGFLTIMSIWVSAHGINPLPLWSPTHLVALWIKMIVLIPLNALWALPTIGWLLLCSAFARSKPFLWAMTPIVAGVVVTISHLMNDLSLPSAWFWQNIVGRLLFSIVPGGWMDLARVHELDREDRLPEVLGSVLSFDSIGHLVTSPSFIFGAIAGVGMIWAAIYLRRSRIESFA